jgi:MraZ protein
VRGLFTGEHELSLDDKKRLMIPRDVRNQLDPEADGEGFYLVIGASKRLSLYTERRFEQLSRALNQPSALPDQNFRAFELMHYGLATMVKPDSVGRITLNDKQVRRSGLAKEVTLVGVGDHLEIWNRDDWERHVEASLTQYDQILQSARQALPAGQTGAVSASAAHGGAAGRETPATRPIPAIGSEPQGF